MDFLINLYEYIIDVLGYSAEWLVKTVGKMGYAGIILLMGLESSFVPFPSEVVIPPAGYLVSHGHMNMFFVIVSGVLGSVLGSLLNYWIAARFGRAFLLNHSRWFFIDEKKFSRFERFFNRHGEITTFVGRLIPVIRQYVSFPAGLARMNIFKFVFYTTLGAACWVSILAYVGYFVGNNIGLVKEHVHTIMYVVFPALAALVVLYAVIYRYKKSKGAVADQ